MARNNAWQRFGEQVQRNLVALISVFIAVSSLGYNTWRNEKTEYNRNLRAASFEMLIALGELRELTYHLQYDVEAVGEHVARTGWTTVFTIRDLSMLLEPPLPARGEALHATWNEHSPRLGGADDTSKEAIEDCIDELRDDTLAMLQALD